MASEKILAMIEEVKALTVLELSELVKALEEEFGVSAAAAAVAAPAAAAGAVTVKAPMPGNILDVKVKAGASVKAGDVLVILEAMKMENEIMAPCDGTVTSVSVTKGAAVESGALLCTIG